MKYGVVYHRFTQNFGDDIQAYAGARFLPRVDYAIDREEIDTFNRITDDYVCAILGAWWMWKKWNWPPSSNLIPLPVGFHVTRRGVKKDASPIVDECFEGRGKDYFDAYGPVGCRDQQTLEMFQGKGIDSYFSGCITLTLPQMPQTKENKSYICLVDLKPPVVKKIKELLKNTDTEIKVMTHDCDYRDGKATWEERSKKVEEYLTIYQNAKCVITRRLHVTLPCLAMETPVVWVLGKPTFPLRVTPYKDWVHRAREEEIMNGDWDDFISDPKENPKDYLKYREELIKKAQNFIHDNQEKPIDELLKLEYSEADRKKWQNDLMQRTFEKWVRENKSMMKKLKTKEEKIRNDLRDSGKTIFNLPKGKSDGTRNLNPEFESHKKYYIDLLKDSQNYVNSEGDSASDDFLAMSEIKNESDDFKNRFFKFLLDDWMKISRKIIGKQKKKNRTLKEFAMTKDKKIFFLPPLKEYARKLVK